MYDQSRLSELIRFARVVAGATVIDLYPGDGDWTRLFSDVGGGWFLPLWQSEAVFSGGGHGRKP